MFLVRNERVKLLAAYFSGLAIASAAIGGIGQVVNAGTSGVSWATGAWIIVSLALHSVGQVLLGRLRE
jgi:hypothetical protein